jgi:photosystem II stability/assembly factor-like uncharacterized protein
MLQTHVIKNTNSVAIKKEDNMETLIAQRGYRPKQIRCAIRRLAIITLTMGILSPALVYATGWRQSPATGMADVAVSRDGILWLAGQNGTVWYSSDGGKTFHKVNASGFNRICVGPDGVVWAVGWNGTLWMYRGKTWTKTAASGIADVAVSGAGKLWLTGKNGSVWYSSDGGKTFHSIEASGFSRVSAGPDDVLWAVGSSGTLWILRDGVWTQTAASGIADVAVAPDGIIWLVGANGTVWTSKDQQNFEQNHAASGFASIAAGGRGTWAVGFNGTLWTFDPDLD